MRPEPLVRLVRLVALAWASPSAAAASSGSVGPDQGCSLLTEALVPSESVPLPDVAPWRPAPAAKRSNSSHFFMYVPELVTGEDERQLRAVVRANQFPSDLAACNRTLLLTDDAVTAGLGYTARLIALALLVAVQEHRVLMLPPHKTRRWCGRPPFTLGCYYEPITHCPYPPEGLHRNSSMMHSWPKWSTRGSSIGLAARQSSETSAATMRMGTSQVHKSVFWYKFHPPQSLFSATHELLFRPRQWVREAAQCVTRTAGLHGGNYAVVHARFSHEKQKERGSTLPPLSAYLPLTEQVISPQPENQEPRPRDPRPRDPDTRVPARACRSPSRWSVAPTCRASSFRPPLRSRSTSSRGGRGSNASGSRTRRTTATRTTCG